MEIYAIADIHGCLATFKELIESKIALKRNDTLYLLGDYINKGPDSKGVLDYIMDLKMDSYHVHCIRGNHDQLLLDIKQEKTDERWKNEMQLQNTLKSFEVTKPNDIPQKYFLFIKSMPCYIELEKYFLVHAGFLFGKGNPLKYKSSMLNIKKFEYRKSEIKNKGIIHGHIPQRLDTVVDSVQTFSDLIKIDGGCVYRKNAEFGNLIALNINSMEIISQSNVEGAYEIEIRKESSII